MVTSDISLTHSCLFYIYDNSLGLKFFVDTKVDDSVIPPEPMDHRHWCEGVQLQAVNSTAINTYSQRSLTLNLGL